jgi:hypothetical protein
MSSTSVYGSKTPDGLSTTHGLYVSGINDPAKNVQSTVNVYQGDAELYVVAGHANIGSGMTDYCVVAANKNL